MMVVALLVRLVMVHVFISFAEQDAALEARLEADLKALELQGLVTSFSSRYVAPGDDRQQTIDQHFENANVILLLVSPAYIRSEYCYDVEVRRAVEWHRRNAAVVLPILARPAYWKHAPFAGLKALPRNDRPITTWSNKDKAWLDVIEGIVEAIEALEVRRHRQKQSA